MLGLAGEKGGLRFVIVEGSIDDQPAAGSAIQAHAFLRPNQPLAPFLNRFAPAGGSHHLAMTCGHLATRPTRLAVPIGIQAEVTYNGKT